MKCPECNGLGKVNEETTGGLWGCASCNGTGEVEVKSRSVQRREALQKGELMPTFDNQPKDGMPERIWVWCSYNYGNAWLKRNPGVAEATEYLRADLAVEREKVRELVELYREWVGRVAGDSSQSGWRSVRMAHLESELFPDGLEEK
jgi:hypothetical protein